MKFIFCCPLILIIIFAHLLFCKFSSASNHLYVGCYKTFSGFPSGNSIQSATQCLAKCRNVSSWFAAVKYGSSCYCGNITNTRVPSSNCNLPCSDKNGTCGGRNYYAIYTDVPSYQGCFLHDRYAHMTFERYPESTINECYDKCLFEGYRFSGFTPISFFRECYCGDKFTNTENSYQESECEICFENTDFKCGRKYRTVSIYSVGHLPTLNKSYNEIFKCRGGVTTMNGTCNSTRCKRGWKGSKCNQRDCSRYNGGCGQHKCENITIGGQNISECVCKEGFQGLSIYDECSDLDECQSNPCNESSETCINTIGSFMCICSPGYNYTYQSDCGDSCSKSLYICENSTYCYRLSNYTCLLEIPDCDKTTLISLGVFLAISLLFVIVCSMGIYFYRKKYFEAKLEKLQKPIQDMEPKSKSIRLSNQYHDENSYDEIKMNAIYEN